jgi:eukaryotic-like serine/threonine-protein kinase
MSDPTNDDSSGPDLFGELAHEFADRLRRGERPTPTEYADRHPELADQIRELFPALAEMEQFGSDLGPATGPFLPDVDRDATVPRVLGDYRVVREIGRGGMGVVYEAVQESLGRHVALKVLPDRRRLAPNQLERFIREAKAAALLHHTNIVPVFGVGAHGGVHYYAMQYIEGQGLDAVLAEVRRLRRGAPQPPTGGDGPAVSLATGVAQGLLTGQFRGPGSPLDLASTVDSTVLPSEDGSVGPAAAAQAGAESDGRADSPSSILGPTEAHYYRSVARLGAQVAEALGHAHAHGILHRDIKPANILMDTQGTAWVTDFGLAKAEGSDELTNPGDIVGTLRYMAPERFRGRSDPRSDVYALGVTLYEMLTTEPAFAATERAAVVEQVMHEEPRRLRAVDSTIPRDQETIVLKAMAREPEARYQSAGELAEDLRRYLADRPIRARRTGVAERAWRWARRNPATAVLAASLALVFVAGLPLVTFLWLRSNHLYRLSEERRADAEASLAQARGAVDDYLTTVSESTLLRSPAPGLQPLRRRLLEAALRYYQDFAQRHGEDRALRADLAAATARVGEITAEIGSRDEAIAVLGRAEGLYKELSRPDRTGRAYAAERGRCLARMGKLEFDSGRHDEAVAHFRDAITLLESMAGGRDATTRARADLAFAHHYLARTLAIGLGRLDEGERHLRRAIELHDALAAEHSDDPKHGTELSRSLSNLGDFQNRAGRTTEALASVRRAHALLQDLVRRWPDDAQLRHQLSLTTRGLANIVNTLGNPKESEQYHRESLALIERVVAENPAVIEYRRVLATTSAELGQFLLDRNVLGEGLDRLGRAREQAEVVRQSLPDDINNLNTLASVERGIGKALGKQGKPAEGLASLSRAVAIGERIAGQQGLAAYDLACTLALCSELAAALPAGAENGGLGAARRYAERSVDGLRRAISAGWKDVEWMERDPDLRVLHDRDDFREVIRSLRQTIAPGPK